MCRTALIFGPKKSDGPIDRNSRENELSLKKITKSNPLHLPFFSCTRFWFHFSLSLPFSYEFFSFDFYSFLLLFSLFLFSSHFPIISSSHFFLFFFFLFALSLLLFGALTAWVKRRKFPSFLPQAKCVAFHFPSFSFIS